MTADQCYQRAEGCAANAQVAADETVSLEFLRLAAQWRAMAARTIVLEAVDDPGLGAPHLTFEGTCSGLSGAVTSDSE